MTPTPWQVRLRQLITRAARDLGYPEGYAPAQDKYRVWARRNGMPSDSQLFNRTPGQTWRATVRYAGLRPSSELYVPDRTRTKGAVPPMTREQLRRVMREDLRRVAKLRGQPDRMPPRKYYRAHGRFFENQVLEQIAGSRRASWHDVAASVNLLPNRWRNGFWTLERVESAYRAAAKELGRKPGGPGLTSEEIERHIAGTRTLSRFGTVNELAERFGFQPWPSGFVRNHPTPGKRQGKGCMRRAA